MKTIERVASWFLGRLVWLWAKTSLWPSEDNAYAYSYPEEMDEDQIEEEEDGIVEEEETEYVEEPHTLGSSNDMEQGGDSKDDKDINRLRINRTRPETCDQEVKLINESNQS